MRLGEIESSANIFAVQPKLDGVVHLSTPPRLKNLKKRPRTQFLQSQARGERFALRDGAASDAAQEKIKQPLAGGGIIENIAK